MSVTNYVLILCVVNLLCVIQTENGLENDELTFDDTSFIFSNILRKKREQKVWGPWESWTPCSASCGVGKMFKFRYCISEDCGEDEKESKIKSCQIEPCKGKYFGNM